MYDARFPETYESLGSVSYGLSCDLTVFHVICTEGTREMRSKCSDNIQFFSPFKNIRKMFKGSGESFGEKFK